MSDTINLDPDDLTIADLADFEDIVGKPLLEVIPITPEAAAGFMPPARALLALVWITKRKTDPNFTLEDAGKLRVVDLQIDAADPTPASA